MLFNTDILNRIRGVAWSFERDYGYNNIRQLSPNGKMIRVPLWSAPLWNFKYTWGYIKDWTDDIQVGETYTDFKILLGQLLPLMGEYNEFDYQPDDSVVTTQTLTVDTLGNAQIVHNIGGFLEPVQNLAGGNITHLYHDGVLQSLPSINQPSSIAPYLGYVLSGQPTDGTVVTVDFTYYYRCMLDIQTGPSSNFGNSHTNGFATIRGSRLNEMLFELKELSFSQVRI